MRDTTLDSVHSSNGMGHTVNTNSRIGDMLQVVLFGAVWVSSSIYQTLAVIKAEVRLLSESLWNLVNPLAQFRLVWFLISDFRVWIAVSVGLTAFYLGNSIKDPASEDAEQTAKWIAGAAFVVGAVAGVTLFGLFDWPGYLYSRPITDW